MGDGALVVTTGASENESPCVPLVEDPREDPCIFVGVGGCHFGGGGHFGIWGDKSRFSPARLVALIFPFVNASATTTRARAAPYPPLSPSLPMAPKKKAKTTAGSTAAAAGQSDGASSSRGAAATATRSKHEELLLREFMLGLRAIREAGTKPPKEAGDGNANANDDDEEDDDQGSNASEPEVDEDEAREKREKERDEAGAYTRSHFSST